LGTPDSAVIVPDLDVVEAAGGFAADGDGSCAVMDKRIVDLQ